jgi:ABC-type amino acid transport substrate-binding protein
MKKTLYFLLLLICACVLGGVLGNVASGSFAWLGYSRSFAFNLDKFIDTDILVLTFGISMSISVAQVIFIAIAIYAYIKTALVVAEDNTDITSFEDLEGKLTSNSLGSTYADLAVKYGADVQNVDTLSETVDMVLSGRVDATLNAEVSFYDYLAEHPDAPIKIVALTEDASEVSIPLVKGADNDTLCAAIDQAILELAVDGKLSELSEKYFGADISTQ